MKRTLTLAIFGLWTATLAGAATMEELDANGDGMVTLDEFQSMYSEAPEGAFIAIDTNADGTLDDEELAAATEAGLMPMEEI